MPYVNVVVELNIRSVVENKMDRLDYIVDTLNGINRDVVLFEVKEYKISGVNYIKVYFVKENISNDIMMFSTDTENSSGLRSMCARELLRYLMFSKDTSTIDNSYGRLISTYSAKTIFKNE